MRRLTVGCTAAILFAGASAAQQVPRGGILTLTSPKRCAPGADSADYRKGKPPSLKLGDQPPASQLYTVYTVVDGCPQPVVLRKGIGGNTQNQAPVLRTPPRATNTD